MKIGFLIIPFADRPLEELLRALKADFPSLECIEIGVSHYGAAHCDPPRLAGDAARRAAFEDLVVAGGFRVSAFSAHGNPLHPRREIAEDSLARLRDAMRLMSRLDACLARDASGDPVRVVNCFSGLPSPDVVLEPDGTVRQSGTVPGWQIAPWPDEHCDSFAQQMAYGGKVWRELVAEARGAGVALALELHPNFLAHNLETYVELLERSGDDGTTLGINFDPSHFFWRNMDPIAMVRHLGTALATRPIKHCHGKDACVDPYNTAINGCLSATPYSREARRVWRFVTIGEGCDPVNGAHDLNWWARFVTELQLGGYDHVISIEHEDSRKSFGEGLGKALRVLDQAVNRQSPGPMTWAGR